MSRFLKERLNDADAEHQREDRQSDRERGKHIGLDGCRRIGEIDNGGNEWERIHGFFWLVRHYDESRLNATNGNTTAKPAKNA